MEKLKQLNFEAHAHIKNIIGQDMINDDNIAVKELVKNSIDADATEVIVSFKGTSEKSLDAEISVLDNGNGMSLEDIERKWLNMAYSSKKNDENRSYAGNKGIGRFSADRLGRILHLYTKQKNDSKIIKIEIDWGAFEGLQDWQDRIQKIKFQSYILSPQDFLSEANIKNFSHGTYLKIMCPRYVWQHDKLSSLKKDLEKFMIPRQVKGGENFELILHAHDYDYDKKKGIISGPIINQVFEKLPFKTSYIESSIDGAGSEIITRLFHRGELLIELVEKNKFGSLRDASIILFYLNPYHKAFFKRETGLHAVEYGSIFLYLNGFRVPPYGEVENDWLGVDRRHGQGYNRNLGLRELLGRVELMDFAGKTYEVTSDREGIKRNEAFIQLKDISDGFFGHVLKKLEKFVVDGLSWDSTSEDNNALNKRVDLFNSDLDDFETRYAISESDKELTLVRMLDSIILRDTKKQDIINISFGAKALDILNRQRAEEIEKLQEKLDRFEVKIEAGGKNFRPADLIKTIKKAQKEITVLRSEVSNLKKEKVDAFDELNVEKKKRLFAEAHMTADGQKLTEIIHLTGHWGEKIGGSLTRILASLRQGAAISRDEIIAEAESAKMLSAKISKLSRLIVKANFALMSDRTRLDIFSYIEEYVHEIKDLGSHATKINISFLNPGKSRLLLNMSAIEVAMLVDNIIINAEKHDAKLMTISVVEDELSVKINFENDGKALTGEFSPDALFEPGITTTDGSGIGLYQVRTIAKSLDATVSISNRSDITGALVCMEWKHEA